MNPTDMMWTEKYRPKHIKDMVGEFKEQILNYIKEPNSMQHLLLSSKTAGTGKSSLAKAIINELGADALILNSSSDRKIETVREKVNSFVKTKSTKPNLRRIVLLDEADGLTAASQDALRNLMETYHSNALFILTCNKKHKIIDALQSRCVTFNFSLPNKTEIYDRLKFICEQEGLEYTEKGLKALINLNYPSIRDCVKELQSLKVQGLKVEESTAKTNDTINEELWQKIITDKDWNYVKEYVFANDIDVQELNKYFWFKATMNSHIKIMQITATNEVKFNGADELVVFVTSLTEMVK